MEFTFNPDQDNEKEFDKFVGKDFWIRVYSRYNGDYRYIKLINYTNTGVNYRTIYSDLFMGNTGWYDSNDLGWQCYQDFEDFFWDFHIAQPMDVYTTEDILDMF